MEKRLAQEKKGRAEKNETRRYTNLIDFCLKFITHVNQLYIILFTLWK